MKKKLHILFVCGWYPSDKSPTNGDFIQRHAEAVATLHKVSVLHIVSYEKNTTSIQIKSFTKNNVNTCIAYVNPSKYKIFKAYLFFKAFKKIIRSINQFDIVHLNKLYPFGFFALYLKWIHRKPYIISEHWSGYHQKLTKNISFIEKLFSKVICFESNFICPVSNHLAKEMKYFGLKGNYKKIPNVVNTDLFNISIKKEPVFTFVHISNMVEKYKNISGILNVIAKLQTKTTAFKFKFIGAKPNEMIKLAHQLNIKNSVFEFIPHISQVEMVEHLKKSHFFILFSKVENLPCVILEAFSCGIPVITTNVGGISENFPKIFGYLIDSENENQLLEKMTLALQNDTFPSEKMHTYVLNNFSKEVIAKQFSDLYYKTLL